MKKLLKNSSLEAKKFEALNASELNKVLGGAPPKSYKSKYRSGTGSTSVCL